MVQGPDRLDGGRVRLPAGGPVQRALLPARRQPDHPAAAERRLGLVLLQGEQQLRRRQLQHHAAARDRAGPLREARAAPGDRARLPRGRHQLPLQQQEHRGHQLHLVLQHSVPEGKLTCELRDKDFVFL